MSHGPAFIGIGAQKAGTTWLWENLRLHPRLWLPLVKELHWFDVQYPPRALAAGRPYQHRSGLSRYRPLLKHPAWQEARWLWRFYHECRSDQDYQQLFVRKDGRLGGEITPAYATLDQDVVARLQQCLPEDCRIVLVLREPVDRLWSGLRMHCRKRGIDWRSLPEAQLLQIAAEPVHALRSDYARTLSHWSVFADRFGVFFYEDMKEQPALFLASVLQFLQVDASWQSPRLHVQSNPGSEGDGVPAFFREHWQPRYQSVIDVVERHVGRVPLTWRVSV